MSGLSVEVKKKTLPTLKIELPPAYARAFLRFWGNASIEERMAFHSRLNATHRIAIAAQYTGVDDDLLNELWDSVAEHIGSDDKLEGEE